MRKLIICIGIGALLVSCRTRVDDLFDLTASQRLAESMKECRENLQGSENGWMIHYFPSADREFGGTSFTAVFDEEGYVTMTGEIALEVTGDINETKRSLYSLKTSSSVVLSFDTYNDYLHYYSDPDPHGGNQFGGDFEFIYLRGNSSEMFFRGNKTGNTYYFRAIPSGETITSYLQEILDMKAASEDVIYASYFAKYGELEITKYAVDPQGMNRLSYIPDESKPYEVEYEAFAFTPTGIRFHDQISFGGDVKAQTFDWDADAGKYVAIDAVGTDFPSAVVMEGRLSDTYVPYTEYLGNWTLRCSSGNFSVRLEQNVENKSYTMKGLLADYDVIVNYNRLTANLIIYTQYLGMNGSNWVYLCCWDGEEGYFTWSTDVGIDLVYNRPSNPASGILTFKDGGYWGDYTVDSFLIAQFSGPASSDNFLQGAYIAQFGGLSTMNR